MSSVHLEDLPGPTRRASRLTYTAVVAVALVAAVYVIRTQPVRSVVAAAAQTAPGIERALHGGFNVEPPTPSDNPAPLVVVEATKSESFNTPRTSERTSDKLNTPAKIREKEVPVQDESVASTAATTRPQTLEEAIMGKERQPSQQPTADPTTTAMEAVAPPPPAESLPEFSPSQAQAALASAASAASSCLGDGDPSASVRVAVTFAPSGNATNSWVEGPPFAGTPQGGCIAKVFRTAHVNPFSGGLITVRKTFQIR
jgi:hypothetical protein